MFRRVMNRGTLAGLSAVSALGTTVVHHAYASSEDNGKWPSAPGGGDGKITKNADGSLKSVEGMFNYQDSDSVQSSLLRNGKVGTRRDTSGTDTGLFGTKWAPTQVEVMNARPLAPSLDREGFALLPHNVPTELGDSFNFYDNKNILKQYYPSIEKLVKEATGATHVYAFDHNVRSASGIKSGKKLKNGNAVQGPAHIVHTDYTLTSAPQRLRDLSKPPKINDTWRELTSEKSSPLIPPDQVKKALSKEGRFALINVWRNIKKEPVQRFPLAVIDANSVSAEDMTTFEIHYSDRIGENYFIRTPKSGKHRWFYFPKMTRNEALVFKQWDSEGKLLTDAKDEVSAATYRTELSDPPPQFVCHSAFEDPTSPASAPDRESIEVRVMALFLDEEKNRTFRSTRSPKSWFGLNWLKGKVAGF